MSSSLFHQSKKCVFFRSTKSSFSLDPETLYAFYKTDLVLVCFCFYSTSKGIFDSLWMSRYNSSLHLKLISFTGISRASLLRREKRQKGVKESGYKEKEGERQREVQGGVRRAGSDRNGRSSEGEKGRSWKIQIKEGKRIRETKRESA